MTCVKEVLLFPSSLLPQADMTNTGQLAKFNARFDFLGDDEAPEAPAAKEAPAADAKAGKRR